MNAANNQTAASKLLDPDRTCELLSKYSIPTPRQTYVQSTSVTVLADSAMRMQWPVVLKAAGPGLVHKSDIAGVRLGIDGPEALQSAARSMADTIPGLTGFLIQEQAAPGTELIVGCHRDPTFGPVVIVGLGGVWVEVLQDVAVRIAPLSPDDALAMIADLKSVQILDGFRGQAPVDRAALVELLVNVGRLACEHPELVELDLNPVIANSDGLLAVDARALVGDRTQQQPLPPSRDAARSIDRMLTPRSIAIIGASEDRTKAGGRLFHYLLKHGYTGKIYPVNPRADSILGHQSYPSITDVPEVPDLACIATSSASVPGIVAECGAHGVPSAIIFASGFGEAGEAGQLLQAELVNATNASDIRVCGPNTVGVVNSSAEVSMCAAFGMAFEVDKIPRGDIAFVTQSGALGGSLLSRAWAEGIGFSHWVCTGNEADLTLSDYVSYLVDQPEVRVIAIFMEALQDPATFIEAANRARSLGKRVVVYKTGASEVGQRAVQSHTGSLAGDDRVYDAMLRSAGIARVRDLQALVDAAVALSRQPLPRGRRVGVISASGGACSVIADECARYDLKLPLLSPETAARIRDIIPPFGASQNPIDVTMEINRNPGMIGQAAQILLASHEIDALVVLMTTNADPPAINVAEGVIEAASTTDKPVLVARVGAEFLAPASIALYREAGIPLVPMPDRVVKALRAMVDVAGV